MIERLPRIDRQRFLAACTRVELARGDVLAEPEQRHAYFPIDATISLLTQQHGRAPLEVGLVGREGMLGTQIVLGAPLAALQASVQGSGSAWRIGAQAFRGQIGRSPALRHELLRYVHVLMTQLATSAACSRFHEIGPRLARWLLMSQDRAHAATFRVTHEHLATMLGVRRVGITQAAGALQLAGAIAYRRGVLEVLDRGLLEAAACGCYVADRRIYLAFDTQPAPDEPATV